MPTFPSTFRVMTVNPRGTPCLNFAVGGACTDVRAGSMDSSDATSTSTSLPSMFRTEYQKNTRIHNLFWASVCCHASWRFRGKGSHSPAGDGEPIGKWRRKRHFKDRRYSAFSLPSKILRARSSWVLSRLRFAVILKFRAWLPLITARRRFLFPALFGIRPSRRKGRLSGRE